MQRVMFSTVSTPSSSAQSRAKRQMIRNLSHIALSVT